MIPDHSQDRTPQAQWLHDLRNAINGACLTTAVLRSCLESQRTEDALRFMVDLDNACNRCRELIDHPPE